MSAYLSPLAGSGAQFFTNQGIVLSGGFLYTYQAGTTNPLATWTSMTQMVANGNPIVLDSAGRTPQEIWLQGGSQYKFVLTDALGNILGTWDNVAGINDANFNALSEWVPFIGTPTYVDGTHFTVAGNQTSVFTVGRRVQAAVGAGLIYGSVSANSFSLGVTTVTLTMDSTSLDSTLYAVAYGFMQANPNSLPTNVYAPLASPNFTGIPTAPTAAVGTNTNQLATMAALLQAAFAAALPAQPGDAIARFLNTISGTAAWGPLQIAVEPRTSNTALAFNDGGKIIELSGTFTQAFAAVASLKAGWFIILRIVTTADTDEITLKPNGSETIDGLSSYKMYKGESRLVYMNQAGTALKSMVLTRFDLSVVAGMTLTTPPGYTQFEGEIWSGGNSGQKSGSLSQLALGGGGAGYFDFVIPASLMGASQVLTVGSGGAAVTTTANGNIGGTTSIGSLVSVFANSTFNYGGSVQQNLTNAYVSSNVPSVGYEGGRSATAANDSGIDAINGGAGSAGSSSARSGNSIKGSAAGGSVTAAGVILTPGASKLGGNGGAANTNSSGVDGVAPGGGGGATQTGTQSGAGARGEIRIRGVI